MAEHQNATGDRPDHTLTSATKEMTNNYQSGKPPTLPRAQICNKDKAWGVMGQVAEVVNVMKLRFHGLTAAKLTACFAVLHRLTASQ